MLVTLTFSPWMLWAGGIGLVVMVLVGYCIKTWNKSGKELLLQIVGVSLIISILCAFPACWYYNDIFYPKSVMPPEWYNAMKNHTRYYSEMIRSKEMERFIKNGPPKISKIGLDKFLSETALSDDTVIKLLDFVEDNPSI